MRSLSERARRRTRKGLWLVVALVLAVLAAGCSAGRLPTAEAAGTIFGHDISWPQCPSSQGGYGLPLPPASTQFVVVGLTKGLAFTENPCLASQVDWVKDNGRPAHAYTMATFPTSAQLTAYRAFGPWSTSTRAGQLSNVGYAEGSFALASLRKVGFTPPVVWIDVEPRPAQPWPTSTALQQRENRYVVEGLMRRLRDAGFAYGVYSYASGWASITGSWRLPGVPVWATAGRLDTADEALKLCTSASFSGGRVYLSQWYDDTRDYDRTCDPYQFTALAVPPSSLSRSTAEFNGDWNNDVIARKASTNELFLYPGTGRGPIGTRIRIGTSWGGMDVIDTAGDLDGNGTLDVIAREKATGTVWLYRGNGKGGFLPRVRFATGWNGFSAIFGPGDFNGDQRPDLLARERSTGYLWLYPGNGKGSWLQRVRVATGWNAFDALVGPGDLNGDGYNDVLVREAATGYLWVYPGNGRGGLLPRYRISANVNAFNAVMSPGDLNGDRIPDVLLRERSTGYLWLYPRTATGWLARVRIGTSWNTMNSIG
jgi:hypothetical protein